jgi:hypothetical protein
MTRYGWNWESYNALNCRGFTVPEERPGYSEHGSECRKTVGDGSYIFLINIKPFNKMDRGKLQKAQQSRTLGRYCKRMPPSGSVISLRFLGKKYRHVGFITLSLDYVAMLFQFRSLCYKPEGRGFESRWGGFFFNWPNPSSRTMALVSTQPLTEMSTRKIPGG